MVHIANLDRCPTHPGALPRQDLIPATGRSEEDDPESFLHRRHQPVFVELHQTPLGFEQYGCQVVNCVRCC